MLGRDLQDVTVRRVWLRGRTSRGRRGGIAVTVEAFGGVGSRGALRVSRRLRRVNRSLRRLWYGHSVHDFARRLGQVVG